MKQVISITFLVFASCFAAFGQANESLCPTINILTVNEMGRENEPVFFIAEVSNEKFKNTVKYKWTVKNAKILSGQDTRIIKTSRESKDIGIAGLEITGLPKNCNNVFQKTIPAIDPPETVLIAQFGKTYSGEKKAVTDVFLIELNKDVAATGLIAIPNNANSINELKFLNYYIGARRFDKSRISFLITNESTDQTKLYIVPAGAYNPTFENSLIIKVEDFDKLDKLFRPKPITKKRKK